MPLSRLGLCLVLAGFCLNATVAGAEDAAKPRVLVLTDISNEPDDEMSLVRFLVYANEYEVEGLVATTSTWLKTNPREDIIRRFLATYAEVRPNLLKHAPDFPPAEQLAAVTRTGQPGYGMAFVGAGQATAGSQLILDVLARPDPRPLWVTVWGGANTLAQALLDFRTAHSTAELREAVAKLRIYAIADQDDAGAWIRREFPTLFYVVSPSTQDDKQYHLGTWSGISGDRRYSNGPMHHFDLVDNPWLEEHIRNHGPLGALYPKVIYIMEGDTPSFLGLINRGLGSEISPAHGGWGGRYALAQPPGESRPIWTNSADTVTADNGKTDTSNQATIWRWRAHFQHDFAARMGWCVASDFAKANHNPRPVVQGDHTQNVLTLLARGGTEVALSAEGTTDPDGNAVLITWWIYAEAGTLSGATLTKTEGPLTSVRLPTASRPGTVHLILQVQDDGTPSLYSYRRILLEVTP